MGLTARIKEEIDDFIDRKSHFQLIAKEIEQLSECYERKIKVVDLGCGLAEYWKSGALKKALDSNILELTLIDASDTFSKMDNVFGPNVTMRAGLIPEVLEVLSENFFDVSIALDLIEHFPKHTGLNFLYEVDRVTSLSSIIFTPNGLVWQPPSENNPWNAHLSGWQPRELRELGWTNTYGTFGFKKSYGPYGLRKNRFNKFTFAIHLLSFPIIKRYPRLAFSFLAIKSSKNPRIKIHD
jgi:hypothetical protein